MIQTRTIDKCIETLKNKGIWNKEYFKEKLHKDYEIYFEGVIIKSKFEWNKKYLTFYLIKNKEENFFKQFKLSRALREVEWISLSEIIEFKKELIEKLELFEPVLINFFDVSESSDKIKEKINLKKEKEEEKDIEINTWDISILEEFWTGKLNKYGWFKKLTESAIKELEVLIDSKLDNLVHIFEAQIVNSRGRSLAPFDSYKETKIKELIWAEEFIVLSSNKFIVKTGLANSKFNMYYTEEKSKWIYELRKHFLQDLEINESFNSLKDLKDRRNIQSFITEEKKQIFMTYTGLSAFFDDSIENWSLLIEREETNNNYYLNRNSKKTLIGSFKNKIGEERYKIYPFFLDIFDNDKINIWFYKFQALFANSPLYSIEFIEKPKMFLSLKDNNINNLCHWISYDKEKNKNISYSIHLEYLTLNNKDLEEKRIIPLKNAYQSITAWLWESQWIFWCKKVDSKIFDVYYFYHTDKYHYTNNKTNKATTICTFLETSKKAIEIRKFFEKANDYKRSKLDYYKYEVENEKGQIINLVPLYINALWIK